MMRNNLILLPTASILITIRPLGTFHLHLQAATGTAEALEELAARPAADTLPAALLTQAAT